MDEGLTIAEVAKRTALTAHTLRYYERVGLLAPLPRGGNGYRRYGERDLAWIRLLTRLRATGMPIATMRRYAELARAGSATAADRKELLCAHRAQVADRIAQLQEDLALIDYKIDSYDQITETTVRAAAAGRDT